MLGLILLVLALWLACEVCGHDLGRPPARDPYCLERWRRGDGP